MKLEGATGELRRDGSIVYRQDDNGRTICRDNGDNIVLNRDPQSGVLGRSALKTVPLIFGRESERFEPDGNDPALLRSFGEIVAWHNRKDPQHIRIISRKDADDYRQAAVSRHQKRVENPNGMRATGSMLQSTWRNKWIGNSNSRTVMLMARLRLVIRGRGWDVDHCACPRFTGEIFSTLTTLCRRVRRGPHRMRPRLLREPRQRQYRHSACQHPQYLHLSV